MLCFSFKLVKKLRKEKLMESGKGDLLIVDNSISGWTALNYLQQWTEISTKFDIATGFFEVGALLELDGHWQKLEKIRILMGTETTEKTKRAFLEVLKDRTKKSINSNLDDVKEDNPFLNGISAIIEAMKSGQVECRVFNESKFHAKAYITHPKLEVVGTKALIGSSNFTKPGLSKNIELNVQIQSSSEVRQLQNWYEDHWEKSKDITEEILKILDLHATEWLPFDIYLQSLRSLFLNREETTNYWEREKSVIFSKLDQYQKEAYWTMIKIANRFQGAFLCDGVGLGKTFVGLMLIERMIYEKMHVVLFAPKGAKEGVWEPRLRELLPELFGADFSNLAIYSHTDLNREGDYPERFKRIAEIADVVIIDEAHHFRNQGSQGDPETGEKRSRYYKFLDLIATGNPNKKLFMLTATPINNKLTDLRHMIELFTNKDEGHFSRTLGIHNVRAHFNNLEKVLRKRLGVHEDLFFDDPNKQREILESDNLIQNLVIQRSRSYAIASQKKEFGKAVAFPERQKPIVAEYSIFKTYGNLLNLIERAFRRSSPLFSLVVYNPLDYYIGNQEDIDAFRRTRLINVVTLIRTQFLKRFESSIYAFETSCDRLLQKLLAFLHKHCETEGEKNRLNRWIAQNEKTLDYIQKQQFELWGDSADVDDPELFPEELMERWEKLDRKEYKVGDIIDETMLDLDELIKFIEETKKFNPKQDDKLKKLIRMLKTQEFAEKKVIIFTEFADTARYIEKNLKENGIDGLGRIDGGSSKQRYKLIQNFAPYYNSSSSGKLEGEGLKETRILIATDVLSEGLNLQDCTRLINYDIHWNPVRLMQRIGRVDRRMDLEIEKQILEDHPNLKADRGKVKFWNFLPPDELNGLLSLYNTVTRKTLLISKTMGIEGRRLLTPEDEYDSLREFNAGYEGKVSLMEELQLELQGMVKDDPDIKQRLDKFPSNIFSGRKVPKKGVRGVFFCYRLPSWDVDLDDFSIDSGPCQWYLYDIVNNIILDHIAEIITSIKSSVDEPRRCSQEQQSLLQIREKVAKHIKNTYLKQVNVPQGYNPKLVAWMEIN